MDTINEFNFFKQYLYFVTIFSFFYIYIYIFVRIRLKDFGYVKILF